MRQARMRGYVVTLAALALLGGLASTPAAAQQGRTPVEHLQAMEPPNFREGHTLPPLTRWGYSQLLSFEYRVAVADDWGYALEFGSVNPNTLAQLDNPDSVPARLVALSAADPAHYPLSAVLDHPFGIIRSEAYPAELREQLWVRDAEGELVDGRETWSPEAPEAALQKAVELLVEPMIELQSRVPVAMVLDGGESGLNVWGFAGQYWEQDPEVVAAKGGRSWAEYISHQKTREQLMLTTAMREATPERLFYLHYTTSTNQHRNRYGGWADWLVAEYRWFNTASDIANDQAYYSHFNSGWTGEYDQLTMTLNSVGGNIRHGDDLSYNWVCSGWPDHTYSDLDRYMGFLKMYYTAGMTGGIAGYFGVPEEGFAGRSDDVPQWVRQMTTLAHVHATFSHLEAYLRQGYLLPGPDRHRWSQDQPAFELPTGDAEARVVARKIRLQPRWLITAWAAGGEARDVTVDVPDLGEVTLHARPSGSIYRATLDAEGQPSLHLIDEDGMDPSRGL